MTYNEGVLLRPKRPNPAIISGWRCPICGECTVGYGTEWRRIGRRPWKRLVHIDCTRPTQAAV